MRTTDHSNLPLRILFTKMSPFELRAHERTDKGRVERLTQQIIHEGVQCPLLVDAESGTVLDGHHRLAAAKGIGLPRLPVVKVDYLAADAITLDSWDGRRSLHKSDVLLASLSGALLPPRTTKHLIFGRPARRYAVGSVAKTSPVLR